MNKESNKERMYFIFNSCFIAIFINEKMKIPNKQKAIGSFSTPEVQNNIDGVIKITIAKRSSLSSLPFK